MAGRYPRVRSTNPQGSAREVSHPIHRLGLAGRAAARRRPRRLRQRAASSDKASDTTASSGGSTGTQKLTIGYSAWPGWFPLAVAEKEGIFTKAGLDVDLKYFADYTASLDALVAGKLDVNAQTLNDTIFAVASGAKQKIVVVGDNSTGNDAVICDKSINRPQGPEGQDRSPPRRAWSTTSSSSRAWPRTG